MPSWVVEELIALPVIGVIVVVIIWQVGAILRARAEGVRDGEYRKIAERAVETQEATERRLADVTDQLTEMSLRVVTIERILKDTE